MRKFYMLISLTIATVLLASFHLTGQTPEFPPTSELTPENLFDTAVEPLYAGLVLVFGYVSAFIPGINRWAPFLRVVAFGLVVGLGFALFGGASVWKLAISYFLTSGLYTSFFKNILPSPKGRFNTPPISG